MKRLLLWGFFLLSGGFCCIDPAFSADLQQKADTMFLQQLYDTVIGRVECKDRVQYFNRLLVEARKRQNAQFEGTALFLLVKHYYTEELDSFAYYMQRAIPLLTEQNRLEELFRMKAWYVYALTRNKENGRALDSINSLKKLALLLDYPDGTDMANQALADYYMSNKMKEEGLALYEEILAGMEKRNAPLIKRINIIRQLQNKASSPEKRLEYLNLLKKYLDRCDEEGIEKLSEENSVSTLKYAMHRGFAMAYITTQQYALVLKHLKQAEAILKKYNIGNREAEIKTIYAHYYRSTGNYGKAIELFDELLEIYKHGGRMSSYLDLLGNKALVLMAGKRYKDAAQAYRQYAFLKDSLSSANYYKELAELRTQHNLDKLELENKKMENEALRDRTQLLYLWVGVVALVLVCCLLVFLVYQHRRHSLQLKRAKDKAEESDRLKSAFLANMNHEIRTPLNAIVGFSQVLIDEEDQEARRQFAGIIQNNNDLLQRLISDVLDISKIESNTMSLHYAEYDLPQLMDEIYKVILLRMQEGVELQLADCPPCLLYTDRNRLTQVLTNLLTNAIKHTEAGFIRFGYEVTESEVRFFVQDTGKGIPEDRLEQIFSRFVQLDDWSKGVGLGLAICKGLLEKMGGSISVTSKVGEGSVFYVKLPREEINKIS
ncbi:tetratricopeptide repeat-containing sensor histidine kinase [uncultured Parabacteroides sp.]|uniref:tetratricopeptide repeat-containing sensor histidine kinase n=1 Tax=uncultured Parabacteroides sp. TaxID=512312 RepID=UPI00262F8B04|nr:tetratricopeptide repeat-containing sensor histidine kinase [uncultured Parabacteroides sp.]